MAGFSLLDVSKLGWDTTMNAFPRRGKDTWKPCLSFELPFTQLADWKDHYWRVEMTMPSYSLMAQPQKTCAFILFQQMNLRRVEVIVGRATQVWKAWREDQMGLAKRDREVWFCAQFSELDGTD